MSTVSYKCPNCTAAIIFKPDKQLFACDYCSAQFDKGAVESFNDTLIDVGKEVTDVEYTYVTDSQEKVQSASLKQEKEKQDEQKQEQEESKEFEKVVLVSCPSCGSQVITEQTTVATECFYCHAPVILEGKISSEGAPNFILPFEISKEQALEKFQTWIGKKFLTNKAEFNKLSEKHMQGVYFPYWLIDSSVSAFITGRAKNVRTWIVGDYSYTQTDTYHIYREGFLDIPELERNALRENDRAFAENLLPFDFSKMQGFMAQYLLGFQAEQKNVQPDDLVGDVAPSLNNYSISLLKDTVLGYTSSFVSSSNSHVLSQNWNYILLPVWTFTYEYKGERCFYAMNGQTGKIVGNVPIDRKRMILFLLAIAVPVAIALFIGGMFL